MKIADRFGLETIFVLLLMGLGAAISVVSYGYGFGSIGRPAFDFPRGTMDQPGPGLYPLCVGAAISIFALFILISKLRGGSTAPQPERQSVGTLLQMALTFCFWILAMPVLGYVVVMLLATFAFCKIMKLEGWWKPLAVSGGTALFIYLLFDYWMYIDLPRGMILVHEPVDGEADEGQSWKVFTCS